MDEHTALTRGNQDRYLAEAPIYWQNVSMVKPLAVNQVMLGSNPSLPAILLTYSLTGKTVASEATESRFET